MNIVVTGSSTGIGYDCVKRLASLGHTIFTGVRSPQDLEKLKSLGQFVNPILLDVTNEEQIQNALKEISAILKNDGLDGLVNNAGIVVSGPLETLPIEKLRQQLEVNVIGQVAMVQIFLPLLRKAKGRVINVGSVSGLNATPFLGPYCASKFALRALNDSLRLELSPWDISVSLVQPGPIATPIWEKSVRAAETLRKQMDPKSEQLYGIAMDQISRLAEKLAREAIPVSAVTEKIIHALTSKKPHAYYSVGSHARFESLINYMPTRVRDLLVKKAIGLS